MEIESTKVEKPITITNRGMITIPVAMRKRFGLSDGDQVVLIEDEGTIRIIPLLAGEKLREQSCSASEMIRMLEKSRVAELEMENK